MADEVTTAPSADAPAPSVPTQPTEPITTNGEASGVPKQDEEIAGEQATTAVNPPDGEGTAEVAVPPSAPVAEGEADATPAGGKKDKRKSIGGVPEHKNKKLNKKKSMPTLHLDCQPGQFYWARLKGYPPWPAVVCDEQMLPESLLATRPVSTARPDGTLRDDFKEGGKNAKERTFPMMFLSTNEFTWMVNTSLTPLDPEECRAPTNSKMTNALKKAYEIATENHDLAYFKNILKLWQEEQAQIEKELREQEEAEEAEREKKAQEEAEAASRPADEEGKGKKKGKGRKSKGGDDDIEMADVEAPKSSKKRKNESDAEGAKPKKTPKVTKLNGPKTPNGEATPSSKKSTTAKSKKKVVQAPKSSAAEEDEETAKPQLSEAEKLQQREKAVLYLRHRLQKGFLSRDQAPQEAEMAAMADFFSQLEGYDNLEPAIIRTTKVHKVLKAIVKLSAIPSEEVYEFKKRSAALLEAWNKRMEAEPESAAVPGSAVEETNGDKAAHIVPVVESTETPAETTEGAGKEAEETVVEQNADDAVEGIEEKIEEHKMGGVVSEPTAEKTEAAGEVKDGDVAMKTLEDEAVEAA